MSEPASAASRRTVLAGAVGLGLAAALPAAASSPPTHSQKENAMSKPSIVFSHGIWADGSCFSKLIPTLQAEGHDVIAAQYGLDTLKADVDATIAAIERVAPGPVVLVGHSYGGTVITKAGVHPRVSALVFICALGPDETETSASIQAKFPTTEVFQNIDVQNGRVWLKPVTGVPCFAGDLSAEEQGVVYATHFGPDADLFNQKLDGIAWRSKPSWYIVASEDRRQSGAATLRRDAYGRNDRRVEEQPRANALPTARGARRDPRRFGRGRRKARIGDLKRRLSAAGASRQREWEADGRSSTSPHRRTGDVSLKLPIGEMS